MQNFNELYDDAVADRLKKVFKLIDLHEAETYYLGDVEVYGIDENGIEGLICSSEEITHDKWTCFAIEYDTDRMTVRNLIKELKRYDGDLEIVFNYGNKILHFDGLGEDSEILDFFLKKEIMDFFIKGGK